MMNSYKNYINLSRNILMNFDEEFDDVIIRILPKIFGEYYMNRLEKIYNIDNVFKKYDKNRYDLLNKKYNLTKINGKLIFRFRKYNTLEYIIKLLKQNVYFFLEQGESYKSIAQDILKIRNIQCYAKFINEKYKDNYTLHEPNYKFDWKKDDCKKDDMIVNKVICFHPPCLNWVIDDEYCFNHQDKKHDF